jgi:hypothetical protein
MGEHGLLAPHRTGRAETKAHDGTIVTDKVNEMWGTDMTQTITLGEGRAYVFVAVEHAIRKSSAFMPRVRPIVSRRWSRCAKACIGASEPSRPAWRVA